MTTTHITGHAAIKLAETLGLTLSRYADSSKGAHDGLTVSKAREIAAQDPACVYVTVADVVAAHGEQEGRADYIDRADDVALGVEDPAWAWPFAGADDAYISAVSTDVICEECGVADWDEIRDAWLAAFRRGYERAFAEAIPHSAIVALRAEAVERKDVAQRILCDMAIDGEDMDYDADHLDTDGRPDYSGGGHTTSELDAIRRALRMTQDEARLECAKVIAAARAQS